MVGIINLGLGTSMSHFETRYDSEPLLFDAEGRRIVVTIPEWDGNKVLPPIHPATPVGISIDYTFQVKAKLPQLKKPRKAGKKGKKS